MKSLLSIITLLLTLSCYAEAKPNMIIILSDDAGYGDFGFMGSKNFLTPNLDQLAADGVQFSNAYVTACMCAPSRAGLITGKYQQRLGFHLNLPHNYHHSFGLRTSQSTIAAELKILGYKTAAFGKWHLGHEERFHPNNRGFDYFYGFAAGHRSYFPLEEQEKKELAYRLERNGDYLEEAEGMYMTDALTNDAIDYIRKTKESPFFMYLSYSAVHYPMHAKKEDLEAFGNIKDPNRRILAAMTKGMDDNVGRLRQVLKDLKLEKNTLIWFLNDNGGAYNNFSFNGALRGGKGGLSEGGLRVPTLITWPGTVQAGQVNSIPISSLDLAPSLIKLAGGEPKKLDGVSIFSSKGEVSVVKRDLFWASQEIFAMRRDSWKLIRIDYSSGPKFWLFDLSKDMGERNNLAGAQKARIQDMNKALNDWIETHESPDFREHDYLSDDDKNMRLKDWMGFELPVK